MANDFVQTMIDARVDARSLSDFMFYPASEMITRRLAPSIHTLNHYIAYLDGLKAVYTQQTGTVTVNGVQVKAITQAVIDALNSAAIDNNTQVDTLITATPKNIGSVARTQAEKNSDIISIDDFGVVGDGVTNDGLKITAIETAYTGRAVDMLGKTVLVNLVPKNNMYYNGKFLANGNTYISNRIEDMQVTNTSVVIGSDTPKLATTYAGAVIAIGNGAMERRVTGRSCIAIGTRSLNNMKEGRYNVAIGLESQFHCDSNDSSAINGTRNTSVGDNSLRFNEIGFSNVAMGRNAGQCMLNTQGNVAIGTGAMSGFGSLKFKNVSDINITTPITTNDAVAVGVDAMFYGAGGGSVAVGARALTSAKKSSIHTIAIGYEALKNLGKGEGYNGGVTTTVTKSGTYSMTETTSVITVAGLTAAVGDYIYVRYMTGIPIYDSISYRDPQVYKIKSIAGDNYTVDEPDGIVATGTVIVDTVEKMTPLAAVSSRNLAIGAYAMNGSLTAQYNTVVGNNAAPIVNGKYNTALGDTALGGLADTLAATSNSNTALGFQALRYNTDGSSYTAGQNRVGVGARSACSGDNQLQLGTTTVTTYAYGAVQDRSDARDKIIEGDITDAHIDFFNDVEFKRYRLDYRDDYIEIDDDGNVTKLDKDGSKARKREHVGVIAQQVEQAMKAHNVDFAGLQHHAVNGGNDVYTVGYQEFIPILGEIVQRQQKQIDELLTLVKDEAP